MDFSLDEICHLEGEDTFKCFHTISTEANKALIAFITAFEKCKLLIGLDAVTYTLFGGSMRDSMVNQVYQPFRALTADVDSVAPKFGVPQIAINDYDIRLVFGNESTPQVPETQVNDFMAELGLLLASDNEHCVVQKSQVGDPRLRTIVSLPFGAEYDLSFRSYQELLEGPKHQVANPVGSTAEVPTLTISDLAAIDRVQSSSAGISAIAMTETGELWVSALFIQDVVYRNVSQARIGARHAEYTEALQKRKYGAFKLILMTQ
jgi:hypothetical protein